jgi:hypothetical protein
MFALVRSLSVFMAFRQGVGRELSIAGQQRDCFEKSSAGGGCCGAVRATATRRVHRYRGLNFALMTNLPRDDSLVGKTKRTGG